MREPKYVNISLDIGPKLLARLTKQAERLEIPRALLIRRLLAQPLSDHAPSDTPARIESSPLTESELRKIREMIELYDQNSPD